MTECTVAAPVRATKPPARRKATPTIVADAPSKRVVSEASRAASEALAYVSYLMSEVLESADFLGDEFKVSIDLFSEAENQALILAYGDDDDQPVEVGKPKIESLAAAIDAALESFDVAAQDSQLGAPIVVIALAKHAQELLVRIGDAMEVSPVSLDPLRALATYRGAKPFRRQPNPPIQRSSHEQEPARKLRAFELRDMAIEAEMLGMLIEWTVTAHGILDSIEFCAESSPALEKALVEKGIRLRGANWLDCKMDENIVYVLNQQNRIIQQMAGGAA